MGYKVYSQTYHTDIDSGTNPTFFYYQFLHMAKDAGFKVVPATNITKDLPPDSTVTVPYPLPPYPYTILPPIAKYPATDLAGYWILPVADKLNNADTPIYFAPISIPRGGWSGSTWMPYPSLNARWGALTLIQLPSIDTACEYVSIYDGIYSSTLININLFSGTDLLSHKKSYFGFNAETSEIYFASVDTSVTPLACTDFIYFGPFYRNVNDQTVQYRGMNDSVESYYAMGEIHKDYYSTKTKTVRALVSGSKIAFLSEDEVKALKYLPDSTTAYNAAYEQCANFYYAGGGGGFLIDAFGQPVVFPSTLSKYITPVYTFSLSSDLLSKQGTPLKMGNFCIGIQNDDPVDFTHEQIVDGHFCLKHDRTIVDKDGYHYQIKSYIALPLDTTTGITALSPLALADTATSADTGFETPTRLTGLTINHSWKVYSTLLTAAKKRHNYESTWDSVAYPTLLVPSGAFIEWANEATLPMTNIDFWAWLITKGYLA
jgi:hypothetical protein